MSIEIRQRDRGNSVVAFKIECFVDHDGKLVTEVRDHNGYAVKSDVFVTER